MKEIMAYETFDGKLFKKKEDVIAYENAHQERFFLLNRKGEKTSCIDRAKYIYVPKEGSITKEDLDRLNEEGKILNDGLEEVEPWNFASIFYWDERREIYSWMAEDEVRELVHALTEGEKLRNLQNFENSENA